MVEFLAIASALGLNPLALFADVVGRLGEEPRHGGLIRSTRCTLAWLGV